MPDSPGPAGRASREQWGEAVLAGAKAWYSEREWDDLSLEQRDEDCAAVDVALEAALDRLSPSGEGEERVDESSASWQNGYDVGLEHGLHERGGQT